ncbi:MAG: hypothetical protein AAGC54_14905 [Cyanobacteria bacterium P01_F01_bin.4]
MAHITIEVPDEFAQRLEPFQNHLSELFTRFVATNLPSAVLEDLSTSHLDSTPTAYHEVLDFLISRPTSQQIIDFKVSEQSQTYLQTLLQKNREATLNPAEKSELDLYEQLDTLMSLLKVRAFSALEPASEG